MPPKINKSKATSNNAQETNQWVFLTKESILLSKNIKETTTETVLIKLRYPKTGYGALFLSDGRQELHEVLHFKPKYSSWFLDNSVSEDGSLYVTTPVDPLYLILPYLKKYATEKFMTLDQIVIDDEFTECLCLLTCCTYDQLSFIADIKGDDIKVCRLNKTKVFDWLKLKIDCVVEQLKRKNVQVTGGAQVATYIRSNKNSISQESYLFYAHGLISDYLDEELSQEFFDYLGLKKAKENACEDTKPPAKRVKLEGNKSEPLEDYCKNSIKNKNNKKPTKLSVAQKQLQKVDKSGMKSISAFFKPTSK